MVFGFVVADGPVLAAFVNGAAAALGGVDIVVANFSALETPNDEANWQRGSLSGQPGSELHHGHQLGGRCRADQGRAALTCHFLEPGCYSALWLISPPNQQRRFARLHWRRWRPKRRPPLPALLRLSWLD